MRILPVFTYNKLQCGVQNNIKPSSYNIAPLPMDTVSFSGKSAKNAEPLRALFAYKIPDIYSDIILLDPAIKRTLDENHTFAKPIKIVIKALKPLEECLFPVEKEFLALVKRYAKSNPNYTLSDVVRALGNEHNKKLLDIQQPIFDELTEMAKQMPGEQANKFHEMMDIVYKRLHCEPIKLPFSSKEFIYKLKRISDENLSRYTFSENAIMQRIIKIAKKMPEEVNSAEPRNIESSKAKRNKKNRNTKSLIKRRADLLTQIEILLYSSSLKENKELVTLISQMRAKIYGIPLVMPFNRRSFIHDLVKITDSLEDKKLAHSMVQKAEQLPTSHDCVSAFIIKRLNYSSERIGSDILDPSLGCIDHRIPRAKKGKDALDNYCMCSKYYNSERAERSIAQQLKKYPHIYRTAQRQMDRLIELCNKGVFKKVKLSKNYIFTHVKKMALFSPADKMLILNIDKLK